jgi:hypothetical protein
VVQAGRDAMVLQGREEAGGRLEGVQISGSVQAETQDGAGSTTDSLGISKLDYVLLGNGVAMSCQSHWQGCQKRA